MTEQRRGSCYVKQQPPSGGELRQGFNPRLRGRGPTSGRAARIHNAVQVLHQKGEARFWKKVAKGPGRNDCWLWTSQVVNGYGLFWLAGRPIKAHRIAFVLGGGQLHEGYTVCHHCDNPSCVRPDHLFIGTQSDNLKDAVRKARRNPARYANAQRAQRAS